MFKWQKKLATRSSLKLSATSFGSMRNYASSTYLLEWCIYTYFHVKWKITCMG